MPFGGEARLGLAREFLLAFRPFTRCLGQFGGGEFAALGIDLRLLLFVDPGAQGELAHALGMSLQ